MTRDTDCCVQMRMEKSARVTRVLTPGQQAFEVRSSTNIA